MYKMNEKGVSDVVVKRLHGLAEELPNVPPLCPATKAWAGASLGA
jgi:hypothetical protein